MGGVAVVTAFVGVGLLLWSRANRRGVNGTLLVPVVPIDKV